MRDFVLKHPNLTFILGFIFLVLIPICLYRTVKADDSQALQSDRNAICYEKNVPVYETYYRDGKEYSHTTYYGNYDNSDYRYYDYRDDVRPKGPSAWDTSGSAWNSDDDDDDNYRRDYSNRPKGPSAW